MPRVIRKNIIAQTATVPLFFYNLTILSVGRFLKNSLPRCEMMVSQGVALAQKIILI